MAISPEIPNRKSFSRHQRGAPLENIPRADLPIPRDSCSVIPYMDGRRPPTILVRAGKMVRRICDRIRYFDTFLSLQSGNDLVANATAGHERPLVLVCSSPNLPDISDSIVYCRICSGIRHIGHRGALSILDSWFRPRRRPASVGANTPRTSYPRFCTVLAAPRISYKRSMAVSRDSSLG